jgi:hypothetical protein
LKGVLSAVLHADKYSAPYWQKGFFDHELRSSQSYSEKWCYVRDNPVRAELLKHWEEWPYVGQIFDLSFHQAPVLTVSDRRVSQGSATHSALRKRRYRLAYGEPFKS